MSVYMGGLSLDLPILLCALSWDNEPLISNNTATYHRGILMNCLELPKVVEQWSKRSEVARRSLTEWAVDQVI